MSDIKFNTIEEAIADYKAGKMVIAVDDDDMENEGSLLVYFHTEEMCIRDSYTTVTKYTLQDLSILDSYGLKITRNEIFARHGRMFNDQELQEYFKRQQWYVPQIAANDFDTSCLNEVEKYNVNLISVYEEQIGGK